jgi:hypothetical protein
MSKIFIGVMGTLFFAPYGLLEQTQAITPMSFQRVAKHSYFSKIRLSFVIRDKY